MNELAENILPTLKETNEGVEKELARKLAMLKRTYIRCPCGQAELLFELSKQYIDLVGCSATMYVGTFDTSETIPYIKERTAKCPVCRGEFKIKQIKYPKD